jgi:hypothetical protein
MAARAASGNFRALRVREQTGGHGFAVEWGAVFVDLLRRALGAEPFWSDLKFYDRTREEDQLVYIGSSSDRRPYGKLTIEVLHDHPCFGFSADPDSADDWTRQVRRNRACRVRIRPRQMLEPHLDQPEGTRISRFARFNRWTHAAFVDMCPYPCLAVYHDDYNTSYPVLGIVELAIREYYRISTDAPLSAINRGGTAELS